MRRVTLTGTAVLIAAGAAMAGLGCRTSRPTPETQAVAAPSGLVFQADVAPITALAWAPPYLWVGSQRGLRRVELSDQEAEWVGAGAEIEGAAIAALAPDGQGGLWVATDRAVGRLSAAPPPAAARPAGTGTGAGGSTGAGTGAGSGVRFRAVAPFTNVTHLVPVTAGAKGAEVWIGTASGVFFLDGGTASPVPGVAGGATVTSLDLDGDGRTAWVGVKGQGLMQLDRRGARASFGPAQGFDFVEPLGTALLPNGTRFAVGRSAAGQTRLLLLQSAGPVLLEAQPEVPVAGLIDGPSGAALLAGRTGSLRLHTLLAVQRGEVVGGGGFRFSPMRSSLEGLRVAARPVEPGTPGHALPEITAVTRGGGDLFLGTRDRGVIRLAGDLRAADHLPGGELALDARALSVACAERDRCMLATANGRSWSWDGEKLAPLPPTAELGGALMALAGDGAAMVYAVLVAPDGKTLSVVRQAAGGAGRWEPLQRLAMSGEGVAVPTSIVASPGGDLWIAVRDRLATGDEMGRGVVELQLPAGQVVHHRSYAAKEQRPPEALPVAGEVAAVRFRAARTGSATGTGTGAIWLCTSLGIIRFAGGDLTRWGEDEGLETERCTDMIFDGAAVWIGTAGGPARFDGKSWRTDAAAGWPTNREGEPLAARALADCGAAGLRAGTPRGVWSLGAAGPAAAQRPTKRLWDRASGLIDEDVQDLACDRFGRLWVLGRLGVTLAEGP